MTPGRGPPGPSVDARTGPVRARASRVPHRRRAAARLRRRESPARESRGWARRQRPQGATCPASACGSAEMRPAISRPSESGIGSGPGAVAGVDLLRAARGRSRARTAGCRRMQLRCGRARDAASTGRAVTGAPGGGTRATSARARSVRVSSRPMADASSGAPPADPTRTDTSNPSGRSTSLRMA